MLDKPKTCCAGGTNEHTVPVCINRCKVVEVDFCVATLVCALEAGGFRPIASCCGHGKIPPSVLLEDRTMVVWLTEEQSDKVMSRIRNGTL